MSQGLDLMVTGMGTVFVFLTLLVLSTWLMSKIVIALERRGETLGTIEVEHPETADDEELVAVITAAIRQHRQHTQRKR